MSIPTEISWDGLIGKVDLGGGVTAREMISNTDLQEQGRREQHCVGGYTDRILSVGRGAIDIIFSIEKGEEILSTLRLVGEEGDRGRYGWRVGEHSAKRNHKPEPAARIAADKLQEMMETLPRKSVADYVRRISLNSGRQAQAVITIMERHGANIFDPDLPERLLEAYDAVIPRQLRGLSAQEWSDRIEAATSHHAPGGLAHLREALGNSAAKFADQLESEKETEHDFQP